MNNHRKIELSLAGLYFVLVLLQVKEMNVLPVLLLVLLALDIFWIYAFIRSKKIASPGFTRKNLAEKLIVSVLLWAISFNIGAVAYSSVLVKLILPLVALYYLVNGLVKFVSQKKDRLNGFERIMLSLALFGIFFRLMSYPGSGVLRLLSLLTLSVLMAACGFLSMNSIRKDKQATLSVASLVAYLALAMSVLFMLFDLMFWPGQILIFMTYILFSLCAAVFYLLTYFAARRPALDETNSALAYHTLRRMIVYNILALFLFFLSRFQFERLQFGNRPQLIKAVIGCRGAAGESERAAACAEAVRLDSLWTAGLYPEEIQP